MALEDFLAELDEEVKAVNSSDFEIEIFETDFVPSFSDTNITYDNLDTKKKTAYGVRSCLLPIQPTLAAPSKGQDLTPGKRE